MKTKIKNLTEAADRIKLAVKNNEKIIIYADSDCDGITSATILQEAIKNLGGKIDVVLFPNREEDGYGINARALEFLKDLPAQAGKSPALFITLDLGIGNSEAVEVLNAHAYSVIIVDHHQILDSIPNAEVVIDPQQVGDESEFKYLANVGITFKLAEELLGEDMSSQLRKSFLELTALATISDMVPQIGDNKMFIEEGLRSLKNTFRPGLRAFLDILGEGEIVSGGFYKIIQALNAAESSGFSAQGGSALGGKNQAFDLLIASSKNQAEDLAQDLLAKVNYKQLKIQQITEEVERRITQKKGEPIIFEGDPSWKLTLAGPVASIICNAHGKPTFIFKRGDAESSGSVRSIKGLNSVEAMKTCKDFLITYGGHPQASGFRVKNEDLEKFEKKLKEYFDSIKK